MATTYLDQLKKTIGATLTPAQEELSTQAADSGMFENWRPAEIQNFVQNADSMGTKTGTYYKWIQDQQVASREANTAASKDRGEILADLNAWKAGFNESWIAQSLAAERQQWNQRLAQAQEQVTRQYAAMGRVADPLVMQQALKQVASEAASALQLSRMRLEQEQSDRTAQYLGMKDQVFQATSRTTTDAGDVATMIQALK